MSTDDIFRNSSLAITSGLPYIGGSISLLLDKILPSHIEKRYQTFVTSLDQKIVELQLQINEELIQSPKFFSLFLKTLDYAVCEHCKEKMVAFRNILLNAFLGSVDLDISDYFLFLTSTLTVDQFGFLFTMQLLCLNGKEAPDLSDLFKIYPNTDRHYLTSATTEMLRYGLILGSTVTNLGTRYIQYVNSPEEIIKV